MLSPSSKSPQRACHTEESYVSTGRHMSLKLAIELSTVLRPVEFKMYYEFVETRQDGDPFLSPHLSLLDQNFFVPLNLPRPPTILMGELSPAISSRMRERIVSPSSSCSRIFKSQNKAVQAGSFTSARNVFFFGRAGVKNLTCVYRFQGGPHERVKLTINKIVLDSGWVHFGWKNGPYLQSL